MLIFIKKAVFAGFVFLVPLISSAQTGDAKLQNPLKFDTIQGLVAELLKLIIQIGTPIAVVMIVWSGFLFVTARGNQTSLERAKSTLLWTVVGTAILLGAAILASVLENTINQVIR